MSTKLNYMPHRTVDGVEQDLLSIHFCVDFGGRQVLCEFQKHSDGNVTCDTYCYLTDEWSDGGPVDDRLTVCLRAMFAAFDTGERPQS